MSYIKFNKSVDTITQLVEKYKLSGRFTEEMTQSVTNAIEGQDLKIAVIGKMKAGKSSFTNALLFHGNVLPSGPEPTTVTLTEIVYTDDPSKDSWVEVELLTTSDIKDLQANANSENVQIANNAKALLDSINGITGGYEQYVSKGVVEIGLDELTRFTSTEGELSGLAKKVTIHKHLNVLRGLKITDTPGFNDPVKSRGEATKNALKDSHIILFLHDYLDKYDQDEISILLEQVEYTGISMLVDIINKMDMHEDLALNQWSSYVPKFERKKDEAIKQIPKDGIKHLLSHGKTSYVSALMALIGYEVIEYNHKRDSGIECCLNDDTKSFFVEYQSYYSELKSADDFIKFSNIDDIVNIINQLSADKSKYLANYPIQTLAGLLKSLITVISEEIKGAQGELGRLKQNAAKARRQLDAINETFRALGRIIDSPLLATRLRNHIRDTKQTIQRQREQISSDEFTATNYEKTSPWGWGAENRNLSRYKGMLADFDNAIRNKLECLKDTFTAECEAYINQLVQGLVTDKIDLDDRKELATVLIGLLNSEISKGLPISVNPDEPESYLSGSGEQYSLYRSDFLHRRSDTVIDDNYLIVFNTFVDGMIDSDELRNAITEKIEALKAQLKKAIDYSPTEKEEEGKKLTLKITMLGDELKELEDDIKSLEELKNI